MELFFLWRRKEGEGGDEEDWISSILEDESIMPKEPKGFRVFGDGRYVIRVDIIVSIIKIGEFDE